MINSSPWLVRSGCHAPALRLYCFPYSGGHAGIYSSWHQALGPSIEICAVQLPGRAERFGEPPSTSMSEVVAALTALLSRDQDIPYGFFGHSFGALLAFETARSCVENGLMEPVHFFASGCDAPQQRAPSRGLDLLSDQDLIAELSQCGGTPSALLANERAMRLFLPAIRSDLSMARTYVYADGPSLSTPISVLAGTYDDQGMAKHSAAWSRETTGKASVHWFDGDHFFVNSHRREVLDLVRSLLRETLECRSTATP